jgi:hypothetical protein
MDDDRNNNLEDKNKHSDMDHSDSNKGGGSSESSESSDSSAVSSFGEFWLDCIFLAATCWFGARSRKALTLSFRLQQILKTIPYCGMTLLPLCPHTSANVGNQTPSARLGFLKQGRKQQARQRGLISVPIFSVLNNYTSVSLI